MTALIQFAGRAGDRNDRAMAGAELLAVTLSAALEVHTLRVGEPAPSLADTWQVELNAAASTLIKLQQTVGSALSGGPTIVVLNRCAASLGTLPAVASVRPDACVVWFDAHADSNTPAQTTTGYLGGMVLTGAAGTWNTGLGAGLDVSNIVLVGSRDLDVSEQALVDEGTLKLVAPGDRLTSRLVDAIAGRPVYVHLDCDVLDAGLLSSEFQIPGGLSFGDLRACFEALAGHEVVGLEIAEFEATWPDGTLGDPAPLIDAIAPILGLMRGRQEID